MNMNQTKKQIPDKALKLLPWYAIGWLSPQEREYIQEILSQYPEYRKLLATEQEVISTVKEDKSILDRSFLEPTEARLTKVLAQLPNIEKEQVKENINTGLTKKISRFFTGFSTNFQYAVLASMTGLVIALSFAFVAPLLVEQNEATVFHPATTSTAIKKDSSHNTVLLVGLSIESSNPKLLTLLNDNSARIDTIPRKNGMYRIHLSDKLSPEKTKILLKKLIDNKELFWFAGEEF